MLIAFPVAARERQESLRLIQWITELDAGRNHDAVLIMGREADANGLTGELRPLFEAAFKSVDAHVIPMERGNGWHPGASGDATSANNMFVWGSSYCDDVLHRPFLWHEADATPTRKTAYDEIEREYAGCGKPFMGCRVEQSPFPTHMSGNAVYPNDIPKHSVLIRNTGKLAWDIGSAEEVLPRASFTNLIQHIHWGGGACCAAALWNGSAAIFHQCKCGCLVEKLRGGGCSVAKSTVGFASPHEIPAAQFFTEKEHISALAAIADKSPLARGRIKRQLKLKGLCP